MRNFLQRAALVIASSALLAACSQTVGVPPPTVGTAQDYFWSGSALSTGITYYVVRNGAGTNHLLSSTDGSHIRDAALNNEVTMVVHSNSDSVLVDSMGTNSIFSLPSGYFFGHLSPADTTHITVPIYDTVRFDTTRFDTAKQAFVRDSGTRVDTTKTTIQTIYPGDTVLGGLLLLYTPKLDSGASWQAGTITGPLFPNGIPVTATVMDRVDSLLLRADSAGGDSTFGESFQVRYMPAISTDSTARAPIYWLAYYSKSVGPVLIEQYMLMSGTYSVSQRAQIVRKYP